MKEKIPTILHFNMSLIGGFMGGYAVWNFCELLGNAQTANMITLVTDIVGRNFGAVFLRVIGIAVYFSGFAVSVLVKNYTKMNIKLLCLAIDAAAMVTLAVMPDNLELIIYLYPMFFAMSFQWTVFAGAEGYGSSTIFSTNNLRQFSTSLVEYICNKESEKIKKARFYGLTLISFHIGVAVACVVSLLLGTKSTLVALAFLVPAAALVLIQDNPLGIKQESSKVNILQQSKQ